MPLRTKHVSSGTTFFPADVSPFVELWGWTSMQTPTRGSRKMGVDRQDQSSTGLQGEPLHITWHYRSNHHHCESPRENDYLQIVGTQCTLAGISDTISATDGIIDHGAGHQLSAIIQRGNWVPAAVKLRNKDTGSALCNPHAYASALWCLPQDKLWLYIKSFFMENQQFPFLVMVEKTESRLGGRHYSFSFVFILMSLYFAEQT